MENMQTILTIIDFPAQFFPKQTDLLLPFTFRSTAFHLKKTSRHGKPLIKLFSPESRLSEKANGMFLFLYTSMMKLTFLQIISFSVLILSEVSTYRLQLDEQFLMRKVFAPYVWVRIVRKNQEVLLDIKPQFLYFLNHKPFTRRIPLCS